MLQVLFHHTSATTLGSSGHINCQMSDFILLLPYAVNFTKSWLNFLLLFLQLADPLQFAFISCAPFLSGWCFRAFTWCFLITALLFLATCPVPTRSELTSYPRLRGLCKLWGQEDSPCPLHFPRSSPSDITEMQIRKTVMKIKSDLEKTLTPPSKRLSSPLFLQWLLFWLLVI